MREIMDMDEKKTGEYHFAMEFNEKKAEITVVRRQIEIKLMNFALNMLKKEHSSLLACFD